jgi:hypothetical protein
MRRNTEKVINALLAGKPASTRTCFTDGVNVWSYNTLIATPILGERSYLVTSKKYSKTTSEQVNALVLALTNAGFIVKREEELRQKGGL